MSALHCTVIWSVPVAELVVAVIVAVPVPIKLAKPGVTLENVTLEVSEVQVAVLVTSVPLRFALNCCVLPLVKVPQGLIVIPVGAVTVAVPDTPLKVAVIVTAPPVPTYVTFPAALPPVVTLTAQEFELCQKAEVVTSLLPLSKLA